jgi:heterodisulfide reductase subunit A
LGIKFIKYEKETPPKVGKRFVKLKDVRGRRLKISPEVVILTTPLIPSPSIPKLSNLFKVPLTGDGFFLEAHPKLNPIEFTTPGIYLCGSCSYPMDTIEAMTQAYGVGAKIGKIMKVGKVRSEPISGKIQNELCCNCLVCKEVCPGDAIEVEEGRVVVNSFKCKGCGLCVSVCRNKAMEQEGFGTREMVAMIGEML